jgi:uncharacterized membrane protein
MTWKQRVWMYPLTIAMVYVAVSLNCYAFRHPAMTYTQVYLHILDALWWR